MNETPTFKAGVDTLELVKALQKASVGDIVTYLSLSESIGRDVQSVARGSLVTACEILRRDYQMAFGCVRGIGLQRLNDSGVLSSEKNSISRIKRLARRSGKRLALVRPENLSPLEKASYNVTSATLGAISLCVSSKSQHKLEQKAMDSSKLDVGEAMKLFGA